MKDHTKWLCIPSTVGSVKTYIAQCEDRMEYGIYVTVFSDCVKLGKYHTPREDRKPQLNWLNHISCDISEKTLYNGEGAMSIPTRIKDAIQKGGLEFLRHCDMIKELHY